MSGAAGPKVALDRRPGTSVSRVLLVDDSAADAGLVREALAEANGRGYEIVHAVRLEAALQLASDGPVDVVLLDLTLPDSDRYATVTRFRQAFPDLPIVVLTGADDRTLAVRTLQLGAQDYLVKRELDGSSLQRSIRMAIGLKAAEDEVRRLNLTLERRVRERTAELEEAVHELEAFSYSVAHDLRAPLRAIEGFARILLEDHGAHLGEDGLRPVERIRRSVDGMRALVEHLLAFSTTGRRPLTRTPVEPAALVADALDQVADLRAGRDVAITVGALPPCRADAVLLREVYINLLSNALKFTRSTPRATIEIGALPEGGPYFVRDNGAGFDSGAAVNLFGVFQRYHHPDDFEGNGIGLSLCRRIVNRHGGRIWAESAPGRGATFFFTLGTGED